MAIFSEKKTGFINVHDFGHAHGRGTYMDLASFKKDIHAVVNRHGADNLFIGVTNGGQTQERTWLKECGFKPAQVTTNLVQHSAFGYEILGVDASKALEEEKKKQEAHKAALDARPRNAEGRLLRADGRIVRRPYEYFVGDRIRFRETYGEWKEGTIRAIAGTGADTILSLRTRKIAARDYVPYDNLQIVERAR